MPMGILGNVEGNILGVGRYPCKSRANADHEGEKMEPIAAIQKVSLQPDIGR